MLYCLMAKLPETMTIGEFAAGGWRMETLCQRCDGIAKKAVDMAAEVAKYGADYPLKRWMLDAKCPRCTTKLSMYHWAPGEGSVFD
jgi:hypothetical protein